MLILAGIARGWRSSERIGQPVWMEDAEMRRAATSQD